MKISRGSTLNRPWLRQTMDKKWLTLKVIEIERITHFVHRALHVHIRLMILIAELEYQYRVCEISRAIVKYVLSGWNWRTHLHTIPLDEIVDLVLDIDHFISKNDILHNRAPKVNKASDMIKTITFTWLVNTVHLLVL